MIRASGVLLGAALLLGACGSISSASAMSTWVEQSNFPSTAKVLVGDALHSANALRRVASTSGDLHTVCGVLLVDTESANASLPTPDAQATKLLSTAYTQLGAGANECYGAASSRDARVRALRSLTSGVASLSEASARVVTASTP